jgi:hypothetical protein
MALRAEVVDLIGLNRAKNPVERAGVVQITIDEP